MLTDKEESKKLSVKPEGKNEVQKERRKQFNQLIKIKQNEEAVSN